MKLINSEYTVISLSNYFIQEIIRSISITKSLFPIFLVKVYEVINVRTIPHL